MRLAALVWPLHRQQTWVSAATNAATTLRAATSPTCQEAGAAMWVVATISLQTSLTSTLHHQDAQVAMCQAPALTRVGLWFPVAVMVAARCPWVTQTSLGCMDGSASAQSCLEWRPDSLLPGQTTAPRSCRTPMSSGLVEWRRYPLRMKASAVTCAGTTPSARTSST